MIKGSLQVNKGIYHVSFRVTDENGKRIQKQLSTGIKAVKGNKRKAEKRMQEILEHWEGKVALTDNALLCDFIADWIERSYTNSEKDMSVTTYDGYKHMLKKHIYPYFENNKLKVQNARANDFEKYRNDKINEGLSPNTVIKHLALINAALNDAVKKEIIHTNPVESVKRPAKRKPKYNYYTADELKTLLSVSKGTNIELPIFLAVYFGLRRSEVLGLTWSCVNFQNNTLTICNKVVRAKVDGKISDVASNKMKSESSERTFVMNAKIREYLENIKKQQEQYPRRNKEFLDYVCVNEIGDRIKADYLTHKFHDLLKANNMKPIRFHDLRHSCMSLLISNNFNMKLIQDYAGHSDFTITANTYAHTNLSDKQTEIDAITKSLGL